MRPLPFLATVVCVAGAGFTACGDALTANICWVLGNPLLMCHYKQIEELELFTMAAIFMGISIFGVINLWQ